MSWPHGVAGLVDNCLAHQTLSSTSFPGALGDSRPRRAEPPAATPALFQPSAKQSLLARLVHEAVLGLFSLPPLRLTRCRYSHVAAVVLQLQAGRSGNALNLVLYAP